MTPTMSVKQALEATPRQLFVELTEQNKVLGHSIPPQRRVEQVLLAIKPSPTDHILQIGTGAGYLSALLSRLVSKVTTLEHCPVLAKAAQQRFEKLKLDNIHLIQCDGNQGNQEQAPYDIIMITSPRVKERQSLMTQLSSHGYLLAIEEDEYRTPILVKYRTTKRNTLDRKELGPLAEADDTGSIMMDLGIIEDHVLKTARARAKKEKKPLIDILRKIVNVEEIDLYRSLAMQSEIKYQSLDELIAIADPAFFGSFSRSFLDTLHIIPLNKTSNRILVATYDPEAKATELNPLYSNLKIERVLVTPTDFRRLWSMLDLCLQGEIKQLKSFKEVKKNEDQLQHNEKTEVEAHLISLLDAILLDAVSDRASDIHLEQYDKHVRLRFRIDGELRNIEHYQLSTQEACGLVNVIKIRSELNIAEKRLPQGGRSRMQVGSVSYDLRIQVQPSLHGEDVVIRLLPQNENLLGIEDLGLAPIIGKSYQRLLNNPAGLILVVGPTGSGKSTTLYAGLKLLANDGRRKVITAEDPVEYSIANIQQTQIRPEIDFHFSDAMRSFVRQDPDVILVGEIRDNETAVEALRASQTGHVVLSTLHCNDATDALQRLYDLNVHPNSIASELLAVIAQRLAKRICPNCRIRVQPDPKILSELFPQGAPDNFQCFEGKGCNHCDGRGTKGRIGVMEFMQVNTDIRNAISQRQPILELRETALDSGLITMRDSALDHVIQGVIPLSEIPRILPEERMSPEKRGHFGRS